MTVTVTTWTELVGFKGGVGFEGGGVGPSKTSREGDPNDCRFSSSTVRKECFFVELCLLVDVGFLVVLGFLEVVFFVVTGGVGPTITVRVGDPRT